MTASSGSTRDVFSFAGGKLTTETALTWPEIANMRMRASCARSSNGAPSTHEEAVAGFLANAEEREDARWLFWAAMADHKTREDLLRRSANGGYAWVQYALSRFPTVSDEIALRMLDKSVAQGEPDGMVALAYALWAGVGSVRERRRTGNGLKRFGAMQLS